MAKSDKTPVRKKARARRTAPGGSKNKPPKERKKDWRREYYIAPDNVQRAARDLMSTLIHPQFDEFAGRMFAIQDIIDNQELDKLDRIERESSEPAFIEIVRAARREALTGDPEQARTIAGQFAEEAFRSESETVALWLKYQNRIRQRRIDDGYGLIDPPDKRVECNCAGNEASSASERRAGGVGSQSAGTAGNAPDSRRLPVEISDGEISLKFDTDSGPVELLVRY